VGQFVKDRREGYGQYTFGATEDVYEGNWDQGKQHGQGLIRLIKEIQSKLAIRNK